MSPKATRKDIEAARTLVRIRDGHRCAMCGTALVVLGQWQSVHHRKPKGMGGSALLEHASNLVQLCGQGNADGCHGKAHSNPHWARNHGWIVARALDPVEIPVDMYDGWHYLADDGSRTACESPLLQPARAGDPASWMDDEEPGSDGPASGGGPPVTSQEAPMKFAYADPPYLGCCSLYDHYHPDGKCWDDVSTHAALIGRLERDYDGYALSASSPSLFDLLPLFETRPRIAPWVKPFAAFKRNVRIAYTWEPVIFSPGRDSSKDGAPVGRDHISEPITMRKGFTGAKPRAVCDKILDLIGWLPGDDLDDLYPGTGVMGSVIKARLWEMEEINGQAPLDFGEAG